MVLLSQNPTSLNRRYSITVWVFFFCFLWFLIFFNKQNLKHWYDSNKTLIYSNPSSISSSSLPKSQINPSKLHKSPLKPFASPTSPNHHLFSIPKILPLKPFTRFRLAFTMFEYRSYTLFLASWQIGNWDRSSFKD